MRYERKLSEWQQRGLLDAESAARIRAYETRAERPVLLYVLGGLGALTIALGVLAIIASNWDAIPAGVKLALDVGIAAAIAAGIVRSHRAGLAWLRETLIALYFGYVLASIGLIAQVYHLGGATWQALTAWSALCALLMTRGESRGLATAWLIALQVTYGVCLTALAEHDLGSDALLYGLAPLAALLPLAAITSDRVRRDRPRYVHALAGLAFTELAWMASGATLFFYENPLRDQELGGMLIGATASAGLVALLCVRADRLVGGHSAAIGPMRALLVTALALGFLPPLLGVEDIGLVGALAFILLWAEIAWVAHASHNSRLLNTATALIGLRLVVIYFEVFGSLLDTGIGLITGGLLTVSLAWAWARKRRDFAAQEHAP